MASRIGIKQKEAATEERWKFPFLRRGGRFYISRLQFYSSFVYFFYLLATKIDEIFQECPCCVSATRTLLKARY